MRGACNQCASRHPLQHRERRSLRLVERVDRQMRRLLEHVLAGRRGVHHLVGEADPRRPGREAHFALLRCMLIGEIALRRIVQAEHQMVVFAARRLGDAQRRQDRRLARQHRANPRQEALRHRLERLADAPDAILAVRIHVAEDTQDTHAAIRPRRERVDVQPRVVLAPRHLTTRGRVRTIARSGARQVRRVTREERRDQRARIRREARDHRRQREQIRVVAVRALDRAAVEADVLRPAVRPADVQEASFVARQREREPRQHEHGTAFELACVALGVSRRNVGPPARDVER